MGKSDRDAVQKALAAKKEMEALLERSSLNQKAVAAAKAAAAKATAEALAAQQEADAAAAAADPNHQGPIYPPRFSATSDVADPLGVHGAPGKPNLRPGPVARPNRVGR